MGYSSSKGPRFSSQHLHSISQPFVNSRSRESDVILWPPWATGMRNINGGKTTHTCKIKLNIPLKKGNYEKIREEAQQVKALAMGPDNLTSIVGSHMERGNKLPLTFMEIETH